MNTTRIVLEICIASVEDAIAARDGGADRIELNAGLSLGGLTPSLGMLKEVRQAAELPLVVMIRPRAGGYCYSAKEFLVMQRDVEAAFENGADGIAFGVLRESGAIDLDRSRRLLEQASGREAVFHRAFDCVPDACAALEQLAHMGVQRVMTSGGADAALDGADRIAQLVERACEAIEVLPAGKINAASAADLIARTRCRQVHAAVRVNQADPTLPADLYQATSLKSVMALRTALDKLLT